jgi:hypothetical protein
VHIRERCSAAPVTRPEYSSAQLTLGWTSNSQAKPEMLSVLSVKIDLKL